MKTKEYKIIIPFRIHYADDNEGNIYDPLTDRELSIFRKAAIKAVQDIGILFNKCLQLRESRVEEVIR